MPGLELAAQQEIELVPHEPGPALLLNTDILGHRGKVGTARPRHGYLAPGHPFLCEVLPGAEHAVLAGDAGAYDRQTLCRVDTRTQVREEPRLLPAEPWLVPGAAALQPGVQHGHVPVVAIAHRQPGLCHRPSWDAVDVELVEELREEPRRRLHLDVPLHAEHHGHTSPRQCRGEGEQGLSGAFHAWLVRPIGRAAIPVAAARGLAGAEDDEGGDPVQARYVA